MIEEFRYIRHGKPIPEGWELVADFEGTHHGRYSQGIIRKIQDDNMDATLYERLACEVNNGNCQMCGSMAGTVEVHGHRQCLNCKTVVEPCCGGASHGESG